MRKTFIVLLTLGVTLAAAGYLALLMVFKGPSPTFSTLIVGTFMETRRGDKVVHWFYSDSELDAILNQNGVENSTSVTVDNDYDFNIPEEEKNDLKIIDVSGSTFNGKLMIVRDPSRIHLGVNVLMDNYKNNGFLVQDYVTAAGALGGINAGGFDDPNGMGNGSIPQGVVIKDGELVAGRLTDWGTIIGFNEKDHLIVGNMTGSQALEWGLTDAVTFGPVLIVDGEAVSITGTGGGLNPRTVIGQAYDGSVLLLVIDGRQTTSLGASYEDCVKIMLQYGAMNAANLDGGSSSVMVYEDRIVNHIVSMRSDRTVPTAWLVK
ncbi:MAG: phosphodiester glycosidase family protein [Erysipelotrichaceae bacterium]|nr:phosphodiester glycosidase family protein [Erysipelotrichaceae bacterium]